MKNKNLKIAVITNIKHNFVKYVNDYGVEGAKHVMVDNNFEVMPSDEFHKVIKTFGHEDVNKKTVQLVQQRFRPYKVEKDGML